MQPKSIRRILKKYLDENLMSQLDFCRMCDISQNAVSRYMNGYPMHRKIAKRIEKHTEGKILATDLAIAKTKNN